MSNVLMDMHFKKMAFAIKLILIAVPMILVEVVSSAGKGTIFQEQNAWLKDSVATMLMADVYHAVHLSSLILLKNHVKLMGV